MKLNFLISFKVVNQRVAYISSVTGLYTPEIGFIAFNSCAIAVC